jgi:hypothetical protein
VNSVSDYGYALHRSTQKAFPYCIVMLSKHVFQNIHGLGTFELRKHVQFTHPITLDAAVEFMSLQGSVDKIDKTITR